jgi:HK97 family phage prohead protease
MKAKRLDAKRYCPGFVRVRAPSTLDADARTCEAVAVTSDPVTMYGWDGPFEEVLLMDKVRLPKNGQVPLCDSHNRWTVKSVVGSFRDMKTEKGCLVGTVHFSRTAEGEDAFTKVKEGHLTDFSVGYRVHDYESVKAGKKATIDGTEYEGPVVVVKEWELFELSICPIGADPGAKARGDMNDLLTPEEGPIVAGAAGLEEGLSGRAQTEGDGPDEDEEKKDPPEEGEDGGEDEEEDKDEGKGKGKGEGKKALPAAPNDGDRIRGLMSLGKRYGYPDETVANWLANGVTVAEVSKSILEDLHGKEKKFDMGIQVIRDEGAGFRALMADALTVKFRSPLAKPNPRAEELANDDCYQISKACLRNLGMDTGGPRHKVIERAMATSDLPIFLLEASNRVLQNSLQEGAETWQDWTGSFSVKDFKEVKLVNAEIDNELLPISELGEYKYAYMDESAESLSIKSWGRMFAVSREALINDDLSVITREIQHFGQGFRRHIGDSVYGLLANNPLMGDSVPLFDAGAHKNVLASGSGPPTAETIALAIRQMAMQKDLHGRTLNVRPEYFLAPLNLMGAAETFFNSELIGTQAQPTTKNLFYNRFKRIYDVRLDDQNENTWYLVGPRENGILVVYLNGVQAPVMEFEKEFRINAITYKVTFDYGVKAVSWRNFLKVAAA